YLEIYRQDPETVTVGLRVQSPVGQRLITAQDQRIPVAAGGGATRGMLDLAGLPPGSYQLVASLGTADSAIERTAEFAMSGFETDAALAAADATPRDAFERLSESALDTLYMPLIYLMTESEKGVYPGLTVDGKRTYLRQFWSRRDPSPGTPRNEAQDDFYRRIAEANRRFREGGAAQIPGWRTDRGRVFIRYGGPDEVLHRPEAGSTRPYEAWKYTRTRALKYVFYDQTGFGNYVLIWTDDRREPSRPNWEALLGPEGVQDVMRF
ncbi:MAG: GWxTD domain-containing protein, partial [Acidimicrobiales bacterium]